MPTTTELCAINDYIQDVLQTIANLIEIQVAVVDSNFMEICGTGAMLNFTSKPTPDWGIMFKTITTGRAYFVADPTKSPDCKGCVNIGICRETASVSYPITMENRIIGAIGLNCFNEYERDLLLSKKEQFLDFLDKMADLISAKVYEKKYIKVIEEQNTNLKNILIDAPSKKPVSFDQLIGVSSIFKKTVELGRSVAKKDVDILILGESGTGKEPFAKSIHNASPRSGGPFVALNCGAIPVELLESELFGYEKGAFTGARASGKIGKFEQANNGTLFLDEIGDMPYRLQVKLLRAIEERSIERVGGSTPVPVNIRIISATNKDLVSMVRENLFREDLYYRLNVIPITLPPLRERREDIEPFCQYFLRRYNSLYHTRIEQITPEALSFLNHYDWPGNVRELENCVKYLCCTAEDIIDMSSLANAPMLKANLKKTQTASCRELYSHSDEILPLAELEKRAILEALKKYGLSTQGKRNAASALGISKSSLYRKLAEYHFTQRSEDGI